MADKNTLWDAVKARYDSNGLISLTNIRDGSQTTIDDTVGTEAANGTINLFPVSAQEAFDVTDGAHLEAAVMGVIAMLWRRGGTSSEIEQVKWDEVFSPEGIIAKVRRTGPRGHQGPSSNSGVSQKSELTSSGSQVRGWADRESLPPYTLPARRSVNVD